MNTPVLENAAFLDSEQALALPIERAVTQQVAERFLLCVFEDIGKTPKLLDGEDITLILRELLPARFGRRDPLAAHVEPVLHAYLDSLGEREVVHQMFEIRQRLESGLSEFAAAVESGELAHQRTPPTKTIVNRADRVGRNDPCPCGSGKKFKKCCARLG